MELSLSSAASSVSSLYLLQILVILRIHESVNVDVLTDNSGIVFSPPGYDMRCNVLQAKLKIAVGHEGSVQL